MFNEGRNGADFLLFVCTQPLNLVVLSNEDGNDDGLNVMGDLKGFVISADIVGWI
jgi:hypothetical protein